MVMQWPAERDMQDFGRMKSVQLDLARRARLHSAATRRCRSRCLAAEVPIKHRPARDHDRRQIATRGAHQQRGRGLVAAAQQHHAIDGIAADRLLPRPCWPGCGRAWRSAGCWFRRSDMTGNSSGKPPASYTPRFTRSAIFRKWALHGVSSDQVLQIPITGRPSNRSEGNPWFFIQER